MKSKNRTRTAVAQFCGQRQGSLDGRDVNPLKFCRNKVITGKNAGLSMSTGFVKALI